LTFYVKKDIIKLVSLIDIKGWGNMKRILSFLAGIAVFIAIWITIYNLNNLNGYKLNTWIDENGNKLKIPIIKTLKGNTLVLKTYFIKSNKNYLVFPELSGNYAEIYLNNILIEKIGYGKENLVNLYLKPHLIFLGNNLKNNNELKIILFDLYKGGIKTTPVLIDEKHLYEYTLMNFFSYGITSSMGAIIIFSIFLILNYIFSPTKNSKKIFFYYLISLIFLFLASIDFYYIPWGNKYSFFIMKKIFYISFLLAFTFFIITTSIFSNKRKKIDFILHSSLIIPIIFYLFSRDFYTLTEYYNKFSWIPVIIFIYIIYNYKDNDKYIFLYTILVSTIIHDLIVVYYPINGDRFLFSYGILSYSIFVGLLLVDELKIANLKISEVSKKALTDPLTNIYNRFLLNHIKLSKEDTIVFFDLNDLKKINDNYGHEKGDEVLILVSNIVKKHIRNNDYLIRYGGDEFIAIMKDCKEKVATNKFLQIQEELKKQIIPISISYGVSKFNKSLENTLKIADKNMYKMKSIIKKSRKYKYK
jgi:diguanylate cyclase (GGDEF)-like protein